MSNVTSIPFPTAPTARPNGYPYPAAPANATTPSKITTTQTTASGAATTSTKSSPEHGQHKHAAPTPPAND